MRIVPALDPTEEFGLRFGAISEGRPVEQFALEAGEEALGHGVGVAISDGTHRERDSCVSAALPEGQGSVLAALIGVMDHLLRPALGDRHLQRTDHELCRERGIHGPADDSPTEHVKDDGQVEEAR